MIELTIHAADAADLKRQLSELLGGAAPFATSAPSPAVSSTTTTTGAKPKPSPEKTKSAGDAETKAEPTEPEAPPADDTATAAEPSVDYDAVKAATLALVKAKGRDAAVKVLTAHGAAGGATELKPEQYADYLAAVQEAMA